VAAPARSLIRRSGARARRAVAAGLLAPFRGVVEEGARDRAYRKRMLLLLGLVVALEYADRASVGAVGPDLMRAFDISNTEFGFLASAFSVVGAAVTLPAGLLADRTRRTILIALSVALWCAAMGATGAATSFAVLLGARVFLGVVTGAGRPAIFSVAGDVFPAATRGRALGLIGAGELAGDGIGFLLGGVVAALVSWRGVFWTLGAAGLVLVYAMWRQPEPPRGGARTRKGRKRSAAEQTLREADVEPDERLVLEGDQAELSLREAISYVLRVRTQVLVIVVSAISSFFFAGLRTFVVVFAVTAYHVDRSVADLALLVAGLGGIVGLLAGGRIGDALLAQGRIDGRLVVASYSYLAAAAVLVVAFLLDSLWIALPFFVVGAACLSAPIPTLDAVRLDVVHPRFWGRAEGTRTLLLIVAEAGAPLLFGLVSDAIGAEDGHGLRWTFLVALSTLVASGLILQVARRYYPRELAAAAASEEKTSAG
jgi:predicted MFS family arabinose efflux permease